MNLSGILLAIDELKVQTLRDYGSEITESEILSALLEILEEHKKKEIKRKFVAFGPEYILGAIESIKRGNKENREPVRTGVESPPSGGPKLVKAASRAGKSL